MRNFEGPGEQATATNVKNVIEGKKAGSSYQFEQKASSVLENLGRLSGDERAKAEVLIEEYLRKITPDADIDLGGSDPVLSPTAELIAGLSDERKAALLQDEDYRAKILNMYLDADRLTRNRTASRDGDLTVDSRLPELVDTKEFRDWYQKTLLGDVKGGAEKLSKDEYFGDTWPTFEAVLGRLSKKYIDEEFVARPEVQQFLKDIIEKEFGHDLTDSYFGPGRPFIVLRLLKEVKTKGYIKDGYLESEEFQGKLLSAFERWLDGLYLFLREDENSLRKGRIEEIKSYMEMASEFIDKAILTTTIKKSIERHSHNDLYDTAEDEKGRKLSRFLAELE